MRLCHKSNHRRWHTHIRTPRTHARTRTQLKCKIETYFLQNREARFQTLLFEALWYLAWICFRALFIRHVHPFKSKVFGLLLFSANVIVTKQQLVYFLRISMNLGSFPKWGLLSLVAKLKGELQFIFVPMSKTLSDSFVFAATIGGLNPDLRLIALASKEKCKSYRQGKSKLITLALLHFLHPMECTYCRCKVPDRVVHRIGLLVFIGSGAQK